MTIPKPKGPSWPSARRSEGATYLIGDWGRATVIQRLDERDVLIEYDTASLEARRKALEFAEALVVQTREQSPGVNVAFIAAGNHYHVRFRDFGNQELRAVHCLHESLTRRYSSTADRACCPCCHGRYL
jgi:hypothetical protein